MKDDDRRVSPRKEPAQGRSRDLVDAILDGAVRALSALPGSVYDPDKRSASVNRIAEVAGVSIGSLYQYFPGKTAIIAALVRRQMRRIHERLLEVIDASEHLSLDEGAARLVDCIFEMKVANNSVDDIIMREALRHALTAEAFALDTELVTRFADALERWKPKVRPDLRSDLAAHLLFQGLRAVMVVGALARPDLTWDPQLRVEMQRMVVGYLRP